MKSKRTYHSMFAMLDLLFLTCAGFVALFILSFVQIKEKDPNKKVTEAKAEFIVTYIWPVEMDCDVDAYVEDPNGAVVSFQRREDGLMHLDRDDLGNTNDRIYSQFGGYIEYKENREIVTLRGIIPGEYTVNAHLYAKRGVTETIPVTIRVEKVNPFSIVAVKKVNLEFTADEKTALRFTLNKKGEVTNVSDLEKKIATNPNTLRNYNGSPN